MPVDPSTQLVTGLCIAGLIALQGLFAAAEIGYLATGKARARHLREQAVRGAARLYRIKAYPDRVLSTLLVCITTSLYVAESLATRWAQAAVPAPFQAAAP